MWGGEVGWAYGIGAEEDCGTTLRFVDIFIVEIIGWVDADMLIDDCSSYKRMVAYQHRRGISVLPRPPLIPYLIHYIHNISMGLGTSAAIDLARGVKPALTDWMED